MGDGMGWSSGLRDTATATWVAHKGSAGRALDRLSKASAVNTGAAAPKMHSSEEISALAASAAEERRLTRICQKAPGDRQEDEVAFAQAFMRNTFAFYQLWPDNVQRELAKVLTTEGRVRHETVISRGTPQTKVFFLVSGQLRVSVPASIAADATATEAEEGGGINHQQHLSHGGGVGGGAAGGGPSPVPSSEFGGGAGEGQPEPRVLAVLHRGDTCGEASLLGTSIAHADVVVRSSGAVMLSLTQGDFLRALKEILGLRHQDRLMYLRAHPLFVDVSLEDLDIASDLLGLAFFPPGATIHPDPTGEGRVHLVAEGECSVKRRRPRGGVGTRQGGGGGGGGGDAAEGMPLYDLDTCSVLGPLDMFGYDPQQHHHHHQQQQQHHPHLGTAAVGGTSGLHVRPASSMSTVAGGHASIRRTSMHRQQQEPAGNSSSSAHYYDASLPHGGGETAAAGGGGGVVAAAGPWSGYVVEAHSQVKAYHVTREQFSKLPLKIQQVIERAGAFKSGYLEGRRQGLGKLDVARQDPGYGRTSATVKLDRLGEISVVDPSSALLMMGIGGETSNGSLTSLSSPSRGKSNQHTAGGGRKGGSKLSPVLDRLAVNQVAELLQADAVKQAKKATGFAPIARYEESKKNKDRGRGGGGGVATSTTFLTQAPAGDGLGPDASTAVRYGHRKSAGEQQQQLQGREVDQQDMAGLLASVMHPPNPTGTTTAKKGRNGGAAPAPSLPRALPPASLSDLPPGDSAFSKLPIARRTAVLTETPRPQPFPATLRERHTALFQAAQQQQQQQQAGQPYPYGKNSSLREESIKITGSRRGGGGGGGGSVARGSFQQLLLADDDEDNLFAAAYPGQRMIQRRSSNGGAAILGANGQDPASSSFPLLPPASYSSGGTNPSSSRAHHSVDRDLRSPLAAAAGNHNHNSYGSQGDEGSWGGGAGQGGKGEGGALNMTLKRGTGGGGGGGGGSHSSSDILRLSSPESQPGGRGRKKASGSGEKAPGDSGSGRWNGGRIHSKARSPSPSPSPSSSPSPSKGSHVSQGNLPPPPSMLLPGPTRRGRGRHADDQQQQEQMQRDQHEAYQAQQRQRQQQQLEEEMQYQQQQQQQYRGLPASVVLGYENLTPFQWASLMSYISPEARGADGRGSQENVLPQPKW